MAGPDKLTRDILRSISEDHRWIRVMEQLLKLIPADTESLKESVEAAHFESGLAASRAQQALDELAVGKSFGEFFSTVNQAGSAPDSPTTATFNSTRVSKGVSVSGSQVTVAKSGTYKIELRIQL